MVDLEELGRLCKRSVEGDHNLKQSSKMMSQGWEQKTTWVDDFSCICSVPSQTVADKVYIVNLTRSTCTCDMDFQKGEFGVVEGVLGGRSVAGTCTRVIWTSKRVGELAELFRPYAAHIQLYNCTYLCIFSFM